MARASPALDPQPPAATRTVLGHRVAASFPSVRCAEPADLVIEPGGSARVLFAGVELERIRKVHPVTPDGRRAIGLEALLSAPGDRSWSLLWVEVRVDATAAAGNYFLELDGENSGVFLAPELLTIEVAPSRPPVAQRQRRFLRPAPRQVP